MAPIAKTVTTYYPSELERERFWAAETSRDHSGVGVPEGYPAKLCSTLAWSRAEAEAKQHEWTLQLELEDIKAIDSALASFESKHMNLSDISAITFSLPLALSKRLATVSEDVYAGLGFKIIHGLNPAKYTKKQNLAVYAGVAAHIFPQRGFVDIAKEAVTAHIVNIQGNGIKVAPAYTNAPLAFHTDNCDIMALYYLDTASEGGQTILASSWQAYNELAAKQPDVLHTLTETWVLDTFKSYALLPPQSEPLLQLTPSGHISLRYSRHPITGFQHTRNPSLPAPTATQLYALDAVHFTALKNSITLPVVKGDLLFVNDMALMHARQGFNEGGIYLKRNLVKMFFRDPERRWAVPESLVSEKESIYGSNRGDGRREETWDGDGDGSGDDTPPHTSRNG